MRKTNGVFSHNERKMALWALVTAGILAVGGMTFDRLAGPSLGMYGQDLSAVSLPGVLDARPAG